MMRIENLILFQKPKQYKFSIFLYGLFFCLCFSSCAVFKTSPSSKTASTKKTLLTKPKGAYSNYVREIVRTARTYTGTPYRSGGNDQRGVRCSV